MRSGKWMNFVILVSHKFDGRTSFIYAMLSTSKATIWIVGGSLWARRHFFRVPGVASDRWYCLAITRTRIANIQWKRKYSRHLFLCSSVCYVYVSWDNNYCYGIMYAFTGRFRFIATGNRRTSTLQIRKFRIVHTKLHAMRLGPGSGVRRMNAWQIGNNARTSIKYENSSELLYAPAKTKPSRCAVEWQPVLAMFAVECCAYQVETRTSHKFE